MQYMKKNKTKTPTFDPSVRWLEPFYKSAQDLVRGNLRRIKGYRVPLDKEHRCEAQITHYTEGSKSWYVISLATHVHKIDKGWKKDSIKIAGYLLRDFAHELAHTRHFEHTVKHFALECRIERRFIRVLKEFKITNTDVKRPLRAAKKKRKKKSK